MSDLNQLLDMMEEEHDSKNSSSVEKVDQAGLSSVADLARAIRAKESTIAQIEKTT